MKKTKLIALTMVIAMMLIGAGYAAWTDFTEIETTVETGDLDVNVRWASITKPEYSEATITGGQNSNQDENKIVVNVSNLYPTRYDSEVKEFVRIHFAIENQGSVPVMLDDIEFEPTNPDSEIWKYVKTNIHMNQGIINGSNGTSTPIKDPENPYHGSLTGVNAIGMFTSSNPRYLIDLEALLEGTAPVINGDGHSRLAETVLAPGETIWFGHEDPELSSIRFWIDESAPNEVQNEDFGFTLKFNWKQANM